MNQRHEDALEICLAALDTGAAVDRCLSLYPDLTEELHPVLDAAVFARSFADEEISQAALQRSRARLLVKASELRDRRASRKGRFAWLGRRSRLAFASLILGLLFLLSWQGLVVASARSLPGDALYPVKRVAEDINLSILPENETRRVVEARFEQRRVEEVKNLLALGRSTGVRFSGVVESQASDHWMVDDVLVQIGAESTITGSIEPGMVVEVSGQTDRQGWVEAVSIRLHSYQFVGEVEEIQEGAWLISGIELLVPRGSQIDPGVRVGDQVIVLVQVDQNTPLRARAILRVLQPALLPTIVPEQGNRKPGSADDREVELSGIVEVITPTAWVIAGREVLIGAGTEFKGEVRVGDRVKVHAMVAADGSVMAEEIELESSHQNGESGEDEDSDAGSAEDQDRPEDGGNGLEADPENEAQDNSGPSSPHEDDGHEDGQPNSGPGGEDESGDDEQAGDGEAGSGSHEDEDADEADRMDNENKDDEGGEGEGEGEGGEDHESGDSSGQSGSGSNADEGDEDGWGGEGGSDD
jgi:hypothetical protein